MEAGKKLPALCPRVAQLEATLEEHAAWVEAARELLGPAPPEPTAEELAAAATSAAADTSADAAALDEALAAERRAAHASSKKGKKKGGRRGGDGGSGDGGSGDGGSDDPHRLLAEGETDDAAERARVARRAKSILAAVESRLEKRRAADFVDARPAMGAVLEMLSRGDSQPLRSEEGAALAAAAAAAAAWSERLRRTLVRPRSSAGAHAAAVEDTASALRVVAQSIRAAIADLEGTGEPPESEEGQFCLCRQPGGKEMIGCDRCGDWYHLRCVQVTANFARTAKHYVCPACRASAPDGDVFELNKPETTHRHIHRTRRASLATLGEALLEAMAFRGKTEEEDLLVAVFDAHKAWRAAVAAATERRAAVAGVEAKAAEARAEWEAAEAAAATPRDARLARARGVRERAAAVQQAQVLAGATAMAAALLGAGGGGTAAAALEATQRCTTLPPEQQLDSLGQQVAAAAAIKQQQLMQLKGAVAAAAAAGLAGGDASQESVAAAADSAGPFEALLIAQLQELGTFVHQLATSQQHIQAQLAAAAPADVTAQQYQVVIQVMMLQQHYVALSKQQDVQLETLGSGLLERQRVVAAAAAAAMEQDEEDDPTAVETPPAETGADAPKEETEAPEPRASLATAPETSEAIPAAAEAAAAEPAEPKAEPPETKAEPLPVPAEAAVPTPEPAAEPAAEEKEEEKEEEKGPEPEQEAVAPRPVARRKKAPEQASAEELALAAAAATAKAAYDDAAAVLAEATRPSPARQMFAGLKSALAMELDHDPADPELPVLLREVCGASWRARAEKALAPALALGEKWSEPFEKTDAADEPDRDAKAAPLPDSAVFPTLSVLTRLRETGVASGMIVPGGGEGEDALGAKVRRLERLGQKWLDRAADAVDKTRDVPIPVEQVKALMAEGRALPIHLKEELEELGERCEVYCVCETAYDATRPMISCDACEGWFHYECCDMRPPSLDEPEDQDARFTCPPCCAKTGVAYVPFRPPPVETENAQAAAGPSAAEPDAAEPDAEAEAEEEAKPAKPAAEAPAPAEPDAAPAPPSGRGARRRRG